MHYTPVRDDQPFGFFDLPYSIQQAIQLGFCSILSGDVMHYRPLSIMAYNHQQEPFDIVFLPKSRHGNYHRHFLAMPHMQTSHEAEYEQAFSYHPGMGVDPYILRPTQAYKKQLLETMERRHYLPEAPQTVPDLPVIRATKTQKLFIIYVLIISVNKKISSIFKNKCIIKWCYLMAPINKAA